MKTIYGAQIFAQGTWNDIKFTDQDLDMIVSSFDTLGLSGKIPLKLGHEGPDVRDDPRTQFAMGWVKRVYRNGRFIEADMEVPDSVYGMIKNGMLKFVSVELLRNVKASNREIPWVLDAVALLGSDLPAVGILKDLQALTMSRSSDIGEFSEVVTFSRTVPKTVGDDSKMSDENKGLADKLAELSVKVASLSEENTELKKFRQKADSLERRMSEMTKDIEEKERTTHRASIKALFEAAIAEDKITPATRERFFKSHKIETDVVMEVELDDVREYIKENTTQEFKSKKRGSVLMLTRSTDEAPPDMRPDNEALQRVRAYCRENNLNPENPDHLIKAGKAVFAMHKDLGKRYQTMPDDIAAGNITEASV